MINIKIKHIVYYIKLNKIFIIKQTLYEIIYKIY